MRRIGMHRYPRTGGDVDTSMRTEVAVSAATNGSFGATGYGVARDRSASCVGDDNAFPGRSCNGITVNRRAIKRSSLRPELDAAISVQLNRITLDYRTIHAGGSQTIVVNAILFIIMNIAILDGYIVQGGYWADPSISMARIPIFATEADTALTVHYFQIFDKNIGTMY